MQSHTYQQQPGSQGGIDFLQQRAATFTVLGGGPGGPPAAGQQPGAPGAATMAGMVGMPPAPPGYVWQAAPMQMQSEQGQPGPGQPVYMMALPALSSIFLPVGGQGGEGQGQGQGQGQQQQQFQQQAWGMQGMHAPGMFAQWVPAHQQQHMAGLPVLQNHSAMFLAATDNAQASRGPHLGAPQAPQGGHGGQVRKVPTKYPGGLSPTPFDDGADDDEELTILPRRRAGEPEDKKRPPIILTRRDLKELYGMQLSEAAARLDISTTAMKAVCRRAGIRRWPYRRIQCYKSRGIQLNSVSDEVLMMSKTALKRKEQIRTAAGVLANVKQDHAEAGAAERHEGGESDGDEGDDE